MKIHLSVPLLLILFSSPAFAQFAESWFHTYDMDYSDYLFDVYASVDGGYVACGRSAPPGAHSRDDRYDMVLLRVDHNGNTIWHNIYEDNESFQEGNSLVEADNGDIVIGGTWKVGEPHDFSCAAWRINPDGELIWENTFQGSWAKAIIELKNGNFLICGSAVGPAYVTCIDGDGRQLWYHEYAFERHNCLLSMRETDGGVIVAGYTSSMLNPDASIILCLKIDPENEGELVWSEQYQIETGQSARSVISAPGGGFILAGESLREEDGEWISSSFFMRISRRRKRMDTPL